MPRPLGVDEKLALVAFRPDTVPHITVDHQRCAGCAERLCVDVCPAQNYMWDAAALRMIVSTDSCFECGSCRIVCRDGAITWRWPGGGCGVAYAIG